ncbi:MAG: hypothetical protein RL205_1651 [Actinomycetota bacterium]
MSSREVSSDDIGEEFERELARVVERLRTMPLTRLATCSDTVFELCGKFADLAHARGSGLPGASSVPRLGDHALPDQVRVLGMELASTADPSTLSQAYALLVDMRKALP